MVRFQRGIRALASISAWACCCVPAAATYVIRLGIEGEPPEQGRSFQDENTSLVVDSHYCFEEEMLAVAVLFYAARVGTCGHLVMTSTFEDGRVVVRPLDVLVSEKPGLQWQRLRGVQARVASTGPACLGFILNSDVAEGCGIAYNELPELSTARVVMEYQWKPNWQSVRELPADWPKTRQNRQYALGVKVLPTAVKPDMAAFMRQPEWEALRAALEANEDWLHENVSLCLRAVRELFEQRPEADEEAILEFGMERIVDAFTKPGVPEDDHWALQVSALTTFHALELMHFWDDPAQHAARTVEILGTFIGSWSSEFALSEHRGWVSGFGFWDYLSVLYRDVWPENVRPRSPDAASKLLALLRQEAGSGMQVIPGLLPASSWWAMPPTFDPLTLRHQLEWAAGGPRKGGLRAIIIEMHRIEYQELRALLETVSEDLFDAPAELQNYLLVAADRGQVRLEEWGLRGIPPSRGDNGQIYLEHGLQAGLAEVASWTADPELAKADVVAGCTPLWACVALFQVLPQMPCIVRQNMALLQFFVAYEEIQTYWSMLRDFMISPTVTISWKHRLGAEQVFDQTGARPAYVPLISLHTEGHKYQPNKADVLVHRCSHRGFGQLLKFLKPLAETVPSVKLEFLSDLQKVHKKFLLWRDFTLYKAMVLFPHVPNTISFADAYAMHLPIFLPAEPEIWAWTWSQSDPYAGPGFPEKQQSAPWNLAADAPVWWKARQLELPLHSFRAFDHLTELFPVSYMLERAYWYQYTEYYLLPHTRRFRGIANLLALLQDFSAEEALEDSRKIAAVQAKREAYVIAWMSTTVARAIAGD